MVAFPHSKINLGLHVISKRQDGYHNLSTCFYPVPWTDILEILPADEFRFTQTGLALPGKPEDNLCLKAYRVLGDLPPVNIHLHKIIPSGAGLGGGSADAAFTLKMLNEIFSLQLTEAQLREKALGIGSDCPFFIDNRPQWGSGRGEILEPAPISLKGYFLVVVYPDIHVSTAEAFANITPAAHNHSISEIVMKPVSSWRELLVNDFEKSVFRKFPSLKQLKDDLYEEGAIYASMTGSGSSVYGLFDYNVNLEGFEGLNYWSGWL